MLKNQIFLEEYRTGTNNFVKEFYQKAFKESIEYWRAVGYFRSSSLEAFGSTLQKFLYDGGKIKLITSVELTEADSNAINEGMSKLEVCKNRIDKIINEEFKEDVGNGATKLAYLLEIGRLEIKIALPKTGSGIYHEKVGLFFDKKDDYITFSGSANESNNAFESNYECIEVFTSWNDASRAEKKKIHFESLWNTTNKECYIFDFPEASKNNLIRKVKQNSFAPFNDSLFDATDAPQELRIKKDNNCPAKPSWLNVRDYQKEAYTAWKNNDFHGLLSMATGTGKTITAFNALVNLVELEERLATVVVVPYQHLVTQWADEAKEFGIDFIMCFESSKKWSTSLLSSVTKYQYKEQKHIFIITTISTYVLPKFQNPVSKLNNLCIVVDEAHNFGTSKIRAHYLKNAKFRLGLSATPERYMDDEGTAAIIKYFDKIVYEFSLEKAIENKMLTPYKYYPVLVYLTQDEQHNYLELTRQIRQLSFYDDEANDDIVKSLLMKRAKIISGAENKIPALKKLLIEKKLEHSHFNLFYCAAKTTEYEDNAMRMVDKIHEMLVSIGMDVENFTSMDSASKEERSTLIKMLKKQLTDGLVAIKCLDEGVDIPDVRRAFILSSSNNPKEFIQRRGRVLRKANNKDFAEIYDFIVVPLGYNNDEEYRANRQYLEKELLRYREFAKLALNYPDCEKGLLEIMSEYHLLHL